MYLGVSTGLLKFNKTYNVRMFNISEQIELDSLRQFRESDMYKARKME